MTCYTMQALAHSLGCGMENSLHVTVILLEVQSSCGY